MEELTEKEYQEITRKLEKILYLYKKGEISTRQFIDKVFDYFFVTK